MSLDWRTPPADRRRLLNEEVLAELRAHPGKWARIRCYQGRTGVNGSMPSHPRDIEVKGVAEDDGSTAIYARAKGGE